METKERIKEIEKLMLSPDFWSDKDKAQSLISELQGLKDKLEGIGKYDKEDAMLSIYAGAGGDDAEDFARLLFLMYTKYVDSKNWEWKFLDKHENDHGGYRNLTIEVAGKRAYGTLKNEAGVHRLVRLSPFNAKSQRHTSFALVDIVPKIKKIKEFEIPEDELDVQFSKSGGPGGQNVNKRDTAVRIVHTPTDISVRVDSERSQLQNREKALEMLTGKLFRMLEKQQKEEISELSSVSETQIEWGNQIRSYVMHPYKMVKDHRTDMEVRDVDKVFDGNLQEFIDAEKDLK